MSRRTVVPGVTSGRFHSFHDQKWEDFIGRISVDEKLPPEQKALLKFVLEVVCELACCDAGSIMTVEGDNLVIKSYLTADPAGEPSSKIGISLKIGDRVAGRSAATGKPIIIEGDINKDKRFSAAQKFRKINSGGSIPIMIEGKTKGVINISRTQSDAAITKEDVDAVMIVAKNLGKIL